MVWLAFPWNGEDNSRQFGICQSCPNNGYIVALIFICIYLTNLPRLPHKLCRYWFRCHFTWRSGGSFESCCRNIYGHRNLRLWYSAYTFPLRPGDCDYGLQDTAGGISQQSHEGNCPQFNCAGRRTCWREINKSRWKFIEPCQTPRQHSTDSGSRKGAISRAENKAWHTKIWSDISCACLSRLFLSLFHKVIG